MMDVNKGIKILNSKKGVLIAFEGISACGKTENIKELSEHLSKIGYLTNVVEWNSNRIIRKIVDWLHRKKLITSLIYSILQWLNFSLNYITVIRPSLKKGKIVIADRYFHTGLTRDKTNRSIFSVGHIICRIVRKPDMLFFFDTPPEVCFERMKSRSKALFHTNKQIHKNKSLENKELFYLKKMRNAYLKVFDYRGKAQKHSNVILVENNRVNITDSVAHYINLKQKSYDERVLLIRTVLNNYDN